ncbi:MAG: DUF2877 domain-containing protein, partial [Pseudomonadota bacterium]
MTGRVLDAASIGLLVPPIVARAGSATVFAAFERSFYLDLGGPLIAVGDECLSDGPLIIRLSGHAITDLRVETGQHWTATPRRLRRDDGVTIDLTTASIWAPDLPQIPPSPTRLRRGLNHLLDLLRERSLPEDGLLGLVLNDRQVLNAVERAALVPIDALREHLSRRLANGAVDPPPIAGLLGLGPGLTPSGDDLLAGVLITCRHLCEDEVASSLAADIDAAAASATTPISHAHLVAAAQGYAAAPLHDLLHEVSTASQRSSRRTLDAIAKIGHSSGFDAIA